MLSNLGNLVSKYSGEEFFLWAGSISREDSLATYALVREVKPKNIIYAVPGPARAGSAIISAIIKNIPQKKKGYTSPVFLCFNPDITERAKIRKTIEDQVVNKKRMIRVGVFGRLFTNFPEVFTNRVYYQYNSRGIDLFYTDHIHDFVYTRWYLDNVAPKLRKGGFLHVHDIYYNIYGRGWMDVVDSVPDVYQISSPEYLRSEYASLQDIPEYRVPNVVSRYEGTEIYDWTRMNAKHIDIISTAMGPYSKLSNEDSINSSLWIQVKDPAKLRSPWKS